MWIALLAAIVIVGGLALALVFFLAKRNIYFTFVHEGRAKVVMRGGAFQQFLITWKGYTFKVAKEGRQEEEKDNWEVVEGKERPRLFGGLRFYGLWPIVKIYDYKARWTHLHENGAIVTHEERLDFALLKTDLYVIEYPVTEKEAAEDIDGVPLGINLVMPIRIVNPYVALFLVRRWLPLITGVTKATLRAFVAKYRFKEDLIDMTAGAGIEERQREKGIKEDELAHPGDNLRDKLHDALRRALVEKGEAEKTDIWEGAEGVYMFGALIRWRGTDILNIDPDKMYREETTKKYRAEKDREKTIIDADAKAQAATRKSEQRAEEIGGAALNMFCKYTGLSREEVQERLKTNTEEFITEHREVWEKAWDAVFRDMAIEGEAFFDVRVPQGSSIEGLVALIGKIFNNRGGLGNGKQTQDEEENKPERGRFH